MGVDASRPNLVLEAAALPAPGGLLPR